MMNTFVILDYLLEEEGCGLIINMIYITYMIMLEA